MKALCVNPVRPEPGPEYVRQSSKLADAVAHRMSVFGKIVALGTFGSLAIELIAFLTTGQHMLERSDVLLHIGTTLPAMVIGFLMARRSARGVGDSESFIRFATVCMILLVLLSTISRFKLIEHLHSDPGWSAAALGLVLFPVFIPITPRRAITVGLVTSTIGILGLFVTGRLMALEFSFSDVVLVFRGDLLSSVVAYVVARVVNDLRLRLETARSLGSYQLTERIGVGGMGEVWRAKHGSLARPAAIKLIKSDVGTKGSEESWGKVLARFGSEAQATAALESPHTIDLYDFGQADDGTVYYAMELLQGEDLDVLVYRTGRMPAERAVHILLQVCESLAEAHAKGLVHRDIKPSNVFLCRYGGKDDFVKLLDFGLVKQLTSRKPDDALKTGVGVAGTPAFLPPEQAIRGAPVDTRSDIYGVGCLAYWLITGKLVFDAQSGVRAVEQHLKQAPELPSERVRVLFPKTFEDIVMKCLRKHPDERPQSIKELEKALLATGLAKGWTSKDATVWWDEFELQKEKTASDEQVNVDMSDAKTMPLTQEFTMHTMS